MSYVRPNGQFISAKFGGLYTRPAGISVSGRIGVQLTALNFDFSKDLPTTLNVDFGPPDVQPAIGWELNAGFPELEFSAVMIPPREVSFSVVFPEMYSEGMIASYDALVSRPMVNLTTSRFQQGTSTPIGTKDHHQDATPIFAGHESYGQNATPVGSWVHALLKNTLYRLRQPFDDGYQEATDLRLGVDEDFQQAQRVRILHAGDFQDGTPVFVGNRQRWQDTDHSARPWRSVPWQDGHKKQRLSFERVQNGTPMSGVGWMRHQDATKPHPGFVVVIPQPPSYQCYVPSTDLVFWQPIEEVDTNLVFRCGDYYGVSDGGGSSVIVPVRRVYITMNNVQLFKVDGEVELPVLSFSMSIDMDSWTWSFNASIHNSALDELLNASIAEPLEIRAVVNGVDFLMLGERVSRNRSFGSTSVSLSGRGHNAVLGDPYAPVKNFQNASTLTAQQILNQALTNNGVSIGWSVNWGITDWSVPAGSWAMQGRYIDAAKDIVGAAGAFILPDRMTKTLYVKPKYSVMPWDLGTAVADYELPYDVVETEGVEYVQAPDYNGVYLSGGGSTGVLGFVRRTGSGGSKLAPMVTHNLITHADAARQLGKTILADTGKQALLTLSLPVLQTTGIIEPGKIIRYVEGPQIKTGIVQGVSVNMSSAAKLRQTLEVKTYA